MPPAAQVPGKLRFAPFRGRDVVDAGLLTRRQLARPAWRRLLPDIYVHRDVVMDHTAWCKAAGLLLPEGGAISGGSAAFLYGADVLSLDAPVHVSVPRDTRITGHPRLRARRTRLDPGDVRKMGWVPVTTPVRTAFDLARHPDLTEAVVGLDALLHRRVVTREAIRAYLDAHRDWPGVRQARNALALARPLAESPMETRLRMLLVLRGFPCPTLQHEVYHRGVFVARLDLAYVGARLAIEYDGDHHRGRVTFRQDVVRLNALRAAGWTVLRFTADDVLRHPERVVAQVIAVLRQIAAAA
jgi:hypothetical protein